MRTCTYLGAGLLALCVGFADPALAQNPFGGDNRVAITSQKVTQKRWECQNVHNIRMGLVAKHYDPKMNAVKVKIETLHNRWLNLNRKATISVAERSISNMIQKQMNVHMQEHEALRRERIQRENKIKADLRECLLKAGR